MIESDQLDRGAGAPSTGLMAPEVIAFLAMVAKSIFRVRPRKIGTAMRDQSDRRTIDMFPRRGRPAKPRVLSNAARAKRYRKKLGDNGLIRMTVTIPADRRDDLVAFIATLQDSGE
jgi:hypothetical protein